MQTLIALHEAAHRHILAGSFAQADAIYRQMLSEHPEHVPAIAGMGALAGKRGEAALAAQHLEHACKLEPDNPVYLHNYGESLRQLGQLAQAEQLLRQALQLDPGFAPAYASLIGIVEVAHARACGAGEEPGKGALVERLSGELAVLHNNYGNALLASGAGPAAIEQYRRAVSLQPDHASAWSNLGNALHGQGLVCEAESACRKAIALDPEFAAAWNNLGNAIADQGRFEEAPACYDRALALQPDFPIALHNRGSGQLMNLLYLPQVSAREIAECHREWGAAYPAPAASRKARAPTGKRPLRLAYLSADFRQHAMLHFLEPLLAHHDKTRFELTCYAQGPAMDLHTRRLIGYGHRWHWIHELDDAALAARIESDGIDILVDCMGHTQGTRLTALARKPAPVIMSWLGYLGATGLPAIDYRLTDAWLDPPAMTSAIASEVPLRIPGGMMAYQPHAASPEPGALPALANGCITFGSLNNLQKVNAPLVALWSQLLHAVPASRLLLQSKQLADAGVVGRIRGMFEAFGIRPGRLDLRPASPDFLATYAEIDIALDPSPFGGGATTCDALWMGVPVITLCGDRPSGRLSTSILQQLGHQEWIAETRTGYVRAAAALAAKPAVLGELRAQLRGQMQASPLCDAPAFVRRLEKVYQDVLAGADAASAQAAPVQ